MKIWQTEDADCRAEEVKGVEEVWMATRWIRAAMEIFIKANWLVGCGPGLLPLLANGSCRRGLD